MAAADALLDGTDPCAVVVVVVAVGRIPTSPTRDGHRDNAAAVAADVVVDSDYDYGDVVDDDDEEDGDVEASSVDPMALASLGVERLANGYETHFDDDC